MKAVCTTLGPDELATAAAPKLGPALVDIVSFPPFVMLVPCSTSGLLLFGGPIPEDKGEVFCMGSPGDMGEALDCGRMGTCRVLLESKAGPNGLRGAGWKRVLMTAKNGGRTITYEPGVGLC